MADNLEAPSIPFQKPPSLRERNQQSRREMTAAILAAARIIMRRDGVAALNLHEIARMVGVQTSALYKYFPSKAALYDELFRLGVRMISECLEPVYREHGPGWERLQAWAEARLAFAQKNPDLEHLLYHHDVPGFTPSEESMELSRERLRSAREAMQEVVDAGVIDPGMPVDRALDLFLAVSSGITEQHLANEPHLPVGQGRFGSLIPDALRLFQAAWSPDGAVPPGQPHPAAQNQEGERNHAADQADD